MRADKQGCHNRRHTHRKHRCAKHPPHLHRWRSVRGRLRCQLTSAGWQPMRGQSDAAECKVAAEGTRVPCTPLNDYTWHAKWTCTCQKYEHDVPCVKHRAAIALHNENKYRVLTNSISLRLDPSHCAFVHCRSPTLFMLTSSQCRRRQLCFCFVFLEGAGSGRRLYPHWRFLHSCFIEPKKCGG